MEVKNVCLEHSGLVAEVKELKRDVAKIQIDVDAIKITIYKAVGGAAVGIMVFEKVFK